METLLINTKVDSVKDITFDVIADAVDEVLGLKIVNFAPAGYSSKNLVVCGNNGNERRSGVSMRLHSGSIEMLVCNTVGSFVFYGKFDCRMPAHLIKAEFFRIFNASLPYIETAF